MSIDKIGSDKEKRRFKRLRANLSITYRIDKPINVRMMIGNREIRSTMVDLSEGGLSLLTDYDVPPLSDLFIKFTLFKVEDEDVSFYGPMEIIGEVIYNTPFGSNEYRLGIRFKTISKEDKTEIGNFIKATKIP